MAHAFPVGMILRNRDSQFPRFSHAFGMALMWGVLITISAHCALGADDSKSGTANASAVQPVGALNYASAGPNEAVVSGTSTLHNWTAKSGDIQGTASFSGQWAADAKMPIKLDSIELKIPVKSLKSSEGGGMDATMYEALDLKHHDAITYKLTTAKLKTGPAAGKSDYLFDTTGDVTVSGNTHPMTLELDVVPDGKEGLGITTSIDFKMSDYGVKPPVAMLGMVKSGDAITVKCKWELKAAK
jgi:polyisoprenoid-binding protein YceI